MKCPNCGKENPENSKFCGNCGVPMPVQRKKGNKKWGKGVALMIIAIVVIIGGVAVWQHLSDKKEKYLAVVKNQEGKYGYINDVGKEVIPCNYDLATDFCKTGYARVAIKKDDEWKWGVIDDTGREILPCQYDNADCGSANNLLAVGKNDEEIVDGVYLLKWGAVNQSGKQIIPYKYDYLLCFAENGLAAACEGENWGYIDENDNVVIPFQYTWATNFNSKGIAAVQKNIDTHSNGETIEKYGCIDENGNEIIPFEYEDIRVLWDSGLIAAAKKTGTGDDGESIYKWGYLNEKGKPVTSFIYEKPLCHASDISFGGSENDYMTVSIEENGEILYGVINSKGEEIIPCDYNNICSFPNEKMAVVGRNYYKLYSDGTVVNAFKMDEKYTKCYDFSGNGLALVEEETDIQQEDGDIQHNYSFINTTGTIVLELGTEYTGVGSFVKTSKGEHIK